VQGLPTLKAFGQSGAFGQMLAQRAKELSDSVRTTPQTQPHPAAGAPAVAGLPAPASDPCAAQVSAPPPPLKLIHAPIADKAANGEPASRVVRIVNNWTVQVTVKSVAATGPAAGTVAINSDSCSNQLLTPNGTANDTCTVVVRCPTGLTDKQWPNASLSVQHSAGDKPVTLSWREACLDIPRAPTLCVR